jgi:hypothetical protein
MSLSREWLSYASQRKGLRVSYPRRRLRRRQLARSFGFEGGGKVVEEVSTAQRGSHFLSLPLRYSLPLASLSALLHWAISQACFFFQIMIVGGVDSSIEGGMGQYQFGKGDKEISAAMKAPTYLLCVILLGLLMLLVALGFGFRKLPGAGCAMPVVGSCSAAISAACHLGTMETELRDDYNPTSAYNKYSVVNGLEDTIELQSFGKDSADNSGSNPSNETRALRISEEQLMWGLVDWEHFTAGVSCERAVQYKLAHCGFSTMQVGVLRIRKSHRIPHGVRAGGAGDELGFNGGFEPLHNLQHSRSLFLRGGIGWLQNHRYKETEQGDAPKVYNARLFSKIYGFLNVGFTPASLCTAP